MTKMKTMNIRGKEYVPVVERVKAFKQACKAGSIKTKATYFAETKIWIAQTKALDDAISCFMFYDLVNKMR